MMGWTGITWNEINREAVTMEDYNYGPPGSFFRPWSELGSDRKACAGGKSIIIFVLRLFFFSFIL